MEQLPSRAYRTGFEDLPGVLQNEVVKYVAQNSVKDLLNFKRTSRHSYHLGEKRVVYENVNIGSQWVYNQEGANYELREETFLTHCRNAMNPELLWRIGVREFFIIDEAENGLQNIRMATNSDCFHPEAIYTLCMILISRGGANSEDGITMLMSLQEKINMRRKFNAVVRRVLDCIHSMGINTHLWMNSLAVSCNNMSHTKEYIIESAHKYAKDLDYCPKCQWYQEYVTFCMKTDAWE